MTTPAEIRATDALLTALGGRRHTTSDDPGAALLLSLRADVDHRPATTLVTTDQALRTIAHARRRHALRHPLKTLTRWLVRSGRGLTAGDLPASPGEVPTPGTTP